LSNHIKWGQTFKTWQNGPGHYGGELRFLKFLLFVMKIHNRISDNQKIIKIIELIKALKVPPQIHESYQSFEGLAPI